MSAWVHCDNECGEMLPREADELESHWLTVTWRGVRMDACSAACATELIEGQRADDAEIALGLNDGPVQSDGSQT